MNFEEAACLCTIILKFTLKYKRSIEMLTTSFVVCDRTFYAVTAFLCQVEKSFDS